MAQIEWRAKRQPWGGEDAIGEDGYGTVGQKPGDPVLRLFLFGN